MNGIERICDYVIASGSLKGKYHRWRWWKILNQDHMKQCLFVVKKREGVKGLERTEAAEGAAWLQWRKVARKEYKGDKQRRRER